MRTGILRLAACAALLLSCGFSTANAADIPFRDYPAKMYEGPEAPELHFDAESRRFRTRLRQAVEEPVNFGGRYVFTSWPGPDGCKTGGVIDVATGNARLFPVPMCQSGDENAPFLFKPNSRLMVTVGTLGENGPAGMHFFEFNGFEFKPLPDVSPPVPSSRRSDGDVSRIEPAAGDTGKRDLITRVASDPETGPLWSCFESGLKLVTSELAQKSADERSYFRSVISLGGFVTIGDEIRIGCNNLILGDGKAPTTPKQKAVNDYFVTALWVQDENVFKKCILQSDPAWAAMKEFCQKKYQKYKASLKLN